MGDETGEEAPRPVGKKRVGPDGYEFRLRPGKPKFPRDMAMSSAFIAIMTAARAMAPKKGAGFLHTKVPMQRCFVDSMYFNRYRPTPWRKHGYYLTRKDAFDTAVDHTGAVLVRKEIHDRLDEWQKAGDYRRWHIIISPESRGVDLPRLAAEVMQKMEYDIAHQLEWIAVSHDPDHPERRHPHLHIALRGVNKKGLQFRIPEGYICYGICQRARECLTAQLGYRDETQQEKTPARTRKNALRELDHE